MPHRQRETIRSLGTAGVTQQLSPVAALVRRHDPDRFLTALFAPEPLRETLLILYAFNHELARAREVASMPMLALIRLQWWREVVEGAHRQHEVALPLVHAVECGALDRAALLGMVAARETEAEDVIATLAEWRCTLLDGAGGVAVAAAQLLGAPSQALTQVRALGAAYGAAGTLRNVRALARQGRCLLPEDVLGRQGLDRHTVIADPDAPGTVAVRADLAEVGHALLSAGEGLRLPLPAMAAVLPAVLAHRDLRGFSRDKNRTGGPGRRLADRLAVIVTAYRQQVRFT